jgi:hypothetical protein
MSPWSVRFRTLGFATSASPTDHPASAANGRFVRNRGLGALHCESPLSAQGVVDRRTAADASVSDHEGAETALSGRADGAVEWLLCLRLMVWRKALSRELIAQLPSSM